MKTLLLSNLPVYNLSHLLAVRSYQAFHCFSVDKRNSSRLWNNVTVLLLYKTVEMVVTQYKLRKADVQLAEVVEMVVVVVVLVVVIVVNPTWQ